MKILQVIQFFAPKFGGTVDVVYNLSKELSKRGHEITIITTDLNYAKDYVSELENEGVKVIPFKCVFNFASFLYSPSMNNWLKLNIQKFDLVHLHNFRSYQNNIVHKYSKKYDVPYILQAHGSVLPFFQKQKIKKVYDHFWGYKLLEDASTVIALTETERKQYKEMGVPEDKIEIIPNGINLSEYQNLPERGKFRKKYNINNNEKVILYLGRINKIKGIDLLIRSFVDVSKELKGTKLVIVGPDDGFKNCLINLLKKLQLEDTILFTGPLYNKDKLSAYVDADAYVLPSFYETFPNTVIESCACGTPIIITDRCGISDMVKDKVGLVVEYEKTSLTTGLIKILRDDTLKNDLNKNCKGFVLEKFSLNDVITKVEEIYKLLS